MDLCPRIQKKGKAVQPADMVHVQMAQQDMHPLCPLFPQTLDCETDGRMSAALQAFARDGKLLIWDANFTDEDLGRCAGWGHSSWRQGMELGRAAGAGLGVVTQVPSVSLRMTSKFRASPSLRYKVPASHPASSMTMTP